MGSSSDSEFEYTQDHWKKKTKGIKTGIKVSKNGVTTVQKGVNAYVTYGHNAQRPLTRHVHQLSRYNSSLKGVTKGLKVINVTMGVVEVCCAAKDDFALHGDINKLIDTLEEELEEQEYALENTRNEKKKELIRNNIKYIENELRDLRLNKKGFPAKTFKAGSKFVASTAGGTAGGAAGWWAGTQTGALLFAPLGPVGMTFGATAFGVAGAIYGGTKGSELSSKVADKANDALYNIID